MELCFIGQKNAEEFDLIRGEVKRVVEHACHDEFTADDVGCLIRKGKAFAAYVHEGKKILIACVWELIYYPRLTTINVMALGGSRMKDMWQMCGPVLKKVWREQGAKAWQCEASIPMTKLLQKSGIRLKPIYVTSRETL